MRIFLFLIFVCYWGSVSPHEGNHDELYKLLGVERDANVKEIRKAFKSLAVKLHPDKNKDDEEADEKFIKIAHAYEILKDPDTRKEYDLYGETGSNDGKQQYRSYSYYRDQFGIYDDDPLIVTLSRADYEVNVLDDNQAWFVNFYSPNCHHCHELAPTWRKLAAELEGVVRIAAVNCEDDFALCYQLSIEAYPSLLYYQKESHMFEGERYRGSRTYSPLKDFILSQLKVTVKEVNVPEWELGLKKPEPWLLLLCSEQNPTCPEPETRLKLTAILEGLVEVGIVTDKELCEKIDENHLKNTIILRKFNELTNSVTQETIIGADTKEIVDNVLNLLPNPETLDQKKFQEIRSDLRSGSDKPWLICFYLGTATDLNLQLKRLPSLIPTIKIGLVHCGKSAPLCSSLHISRYPSWGVLKVGGAFEFHHGRDVLHEVSAFARDSVKSTNLHALSPADFHNIKKGGPAWFIDWYAPWCPPCRKLMPEIRRASQAFTSEQVQFGTIDCTLHGSLCAGEGITSYPTIMLYNGSRTDRFQGVPSEKDIVEFVTDMLDPVVINLDDSSFVQLLRKSKEDLWLVDFFAPWCGPCQSLGPEWRRLAKEVREFPEVKVAHVDCVANQDLCSSQNIQSYPTIRLYPLGSKGLSSVAIYKGNRDAVSLKRWLLNFLPSPVVPMDEIQFRQQILNKDFILPWLVDFYAPWCGHCTHFEPEFRKVATRLEGVIRSAKVDCEAERVFCATLYVQSYPTVFLYLSSNERIEITEQKASEIITKVKGLVSRPHLEHDEL